MIYLIALIDNERSITGKYRIAGYFRNRNFRRNGQI